jgi:GrpB-like predicted nucleotidyltransferase (UPF0157 family)
MALLQPYDPSWAVAFRELKELLEQELVELPVTVEHVGSTAIPGMPAKPILDVDIIIPSAQWLETVTVRLKGLGYLGRGDQGIPGRYAFRQSEPNTPFGDVAFPVMEQHLYVCLEGCTALRNHLLFRNRLLQHESVRQQYAALKSSLWQNPVMTRERYNREKTGFILSVLAGAGMPEEELEEIRRVNGE